LFHFYTVRDGKLNFSTLILSFKWRISRIAQVEGSLNEHKNDFVVLFDSEMKFILCQAEPGNCVKSTRHLFRESNGHCYLLYSISCAQFVPTKSIKFIVSRGNLSSLHRKMLFCR
jgi:hypothetical protein